MTTFTSTDGLTFDRPARYRIRVKGRVKHTWSNRLEGMAIQVEAAESGAPVCTLVGELLDQAALSGVLNTLYTLRLPVVSVEYLSGQTSEK